MRQEAKAVNMVNFVHLKRNDQHLSFVYGQRRYLKSRVAAAPRRASLDSTADCSRLWLLMVPVPMICRDRFH